MSTSRGYTPQPVAPVPTGAHTVTPRREPSVVGIRESFDSTVGGYVPPEWTLDAECAQPWVDPRVFYPTKGGSNPDQTAKSICGRCIVRETCLEDAIEFETGRRGAQEIRPEVHGTRGGMTAKERRKLIQRQKVEATARTRQAVIDDYVEGSLQVERIAAKHKVAVSSVTRWAADAGVPMRPQGRGKAGQPTLAVQDKGVT